MSVRTVETHRQNIRRKLNLAAGPSSSVRRRALQHPAA